MGESIREREGQIEVHNDMNSPYDLAVLTRLGAFSGIDYIWIRQPGRRILSRTVTYVCFKCVLYE